VFPIYQLNQLEFNGGMAGLQQEKKKIKTQSSNGAATPSQKKKKKDKKIKTPSSRKPCPPAPARKTIHICGVSRMFVVSFDPQDPGENKNAENIQHQFNT
jgi:hypothetical protein